MVRFVLGALLGGVVVLGVTNVQGDGTATAPTASPPAPVEVRPSGHPVRVFESHPRPDVAGCVKTLPHLAAPSI